MNSRLKSITDLTYIALAAALIVVCTWLSIPFPVPVTMQTFAIFTTAGLLGRKRCILAVLVYLLLGAVGLPVFSGFSGGIGKLFGITGGYMFGFLLTALITGGLIDRFGKGTLLMVSAMVLGLLACYLLGTLWFYLIYAADTGRISLLAILSSCVFPFLIPDLVKILLAVIVIRRVPRLL